MKAMQRKFEAMQAELDDREREHARIMRDQAAVNAAHLTRLVAAVADIKKDSTSKPKDLSSALIKRCPIDKTPTELESWMTELAANASGVHEEASMMIKKVIVRDNSVLLDTSTVEGLVSDKWLARQVSAAIMDDSDAGLVFKKEASADIMLCQSGVRLLNKLIKTVSTKDTLSTDAAEQRFKTTVYFKGGMSHDQVKLAAAQFKADYKARSETARSDTEYALLAAMLNEMPPALQEPASYCVRDERKKLEKLSMRGLDMPDWDEFIIDIAVMLKDVN